MNYEINIAMNVRAYGYVMVKAANLDKAVKQITHEYLAENFTRHGDSADLNQDSPRCVWISDHIDDKGDATEIEIGLPDPINIKGDLRHFESHADVLAYVMPELLDTLRDDLEAMKRNKSDDADEMENRIHDLELIEPFVSLNSQSERKTKMSKEILSTNTTAMPSAVPGHPLLIILTVLVRGGRGDDCAAYQAIVEDTSMPSEDHTTRVSQWVAAEGNKLTKDEAERLFSFGLSYRT